MRAGRQRGLVGITFDDGYVSVLEAALPELLRHGFTGTSSSSPAGSAGPTTGTRARPGRCLAQPGARARGRRHGDRLARRHAHPAGRPGRRPAAAEIGGSRARLGELTGAPVRGFAYPYGSMDAAARRAVRQAGYDYACAVQPAGRARAHGAAQDLRRPARRAGPDGGQAALYRGYIAAKGKHREGPARHHRPGRRGRRDPAGADPEVHQARLRCGDAVQPRAGGGPDPRRGAPACATSGCGATPSSARC